MKELEVLLTKRWVLKAEDKDLYYRLRDSMEPIRKFATEKMGCQVIENSLLVKMEKIPAIAQSCMGILEFTSKEEYVYLCMLLMFLEDKETEEQFILSQLTEYITANLSEITDSALGDWTLYTNRRRLIKVLRFSVSQKILSITDGNDEKFMEEIEGEVLYENTGASRYFMKNFVKDIGEYHTPSDFKDSDWFSIDEDRGIARRHRVYKRLLFSPGMYREEGSDEDFEYLKRYGNRLSDELEQQFDCRVQIHKGSAYFIAGEDCHIGSVFPGNNVLSDIILLLAKEIRTQIEEQFWIRQDNEIVVVDQIEWEEVLRKVKQKYQKGFTKAYREMTESEFIRTVENEMEKWTFIKKIQDTHQIKIYPVIAKITGQYPEEFMGEE